MRHRMRASLMRLATTIVVGLLVVARASAMPNLSCKADIKTTHRD